MHLFQQIYKSRSRPVRACIYAVCTYSRVGSGLNPFLLCQMYNILEVRVMQSLGYGYNPMKALYFYTHIFNVWLNIIFQNKLWHCEFTIALGKFFFFFPLSFILKHQNVIFASAMHGFEWKTISQGFPPVPVASSRTEQNSFQWSSVHVLMFLWLHSQDFLNLHFLDGQRWRLIVLSCCSTSSWPVCHAVCWLSGHLPLPATRQFQTENRLQTTLFIPGGQCSFAKKKKRKKEKRQSSKSLSGRDNWHRFSQQVN